MHTEQTHTATGHRIGATYHSNYWGYEYKVLGEPSPLVVEVEQISDTGSGCHRKGDRWTHRTHCQDEEIR